MADRFPSSLSPIEKRTRYGQMRSSLWSERSPFDVLWRELGEWLTPQRTRFQLTDRNKPRKTANDKIIDSTARFAARTLQSGLHAGFTSPARPWMKLTTPDPDLANDQAVKEWLHVVTQRMLTVFQQTNIYNVFPIVYGDLGVFGTACVGILEDTKDLFRAYAYPLGTFAIGLDRRGLATTFIREYQMTVRQVVMEFGVQPNRDIDWTNLSQAVKNLWTRGEYEQAIDVCWVVTPNDYAHPQKLAAKYLPWSSCHFEMGSQEKPFLRESGFRSFPILCPRWEITGEDTYGTDCPGLIALSDVKELQTQQREKGKAIKKMIDPPLQGPTALRSQKPSMMPGDITYVDVREGMVGLRSIHEITLNIQHLAQDMSEVRFRIQRAFFEDLFLMLAQSDDQFGAERPTAREVQERHEEKLLALGPVLERTSDELLEPLVDRTYLMMEAAGLIPEAPEALQGVDLKVEYTSILAEAQKLVGVVGHDRFVMSTTPLIQVFPEMRHKIDAFQLVDDYADMLGIDPRIVRPTEEAEARMQQEQQAAAQAQQAENMAKTAAAVKDASQAPMTGDTALSRMVEGAGAMAGQVPPP
jgi:hypothetical protein